jgi:hypothetical protein
MENKDPLKILFEIKSEVKTLNSKFPKEKVKKGLETQIEAGFNYTDLGRELVYKVNPMWSEEIKKAVHEAIVNKAREYPSIIAKIAPH